MPLKDKFKSYAIILLAVSIWGAFPSILKLTLYDLNIISVITIRFAFSSLLLLYSYGMRKEPVFSIFSQYLEPIFGLIASFSILNDKSLGNKLFTLF